MKTACLNGYSNWWFSDDRENAKNKFKEQNNNSQLFKYVCASFLFFVILSTTTERTELKLSDDTFMEDMIARLQFFFYLLNLEAGSLHGPLGIPVRAQTTHLSARKNACFSGYQKIDRPQSMSELE